MSLNPDESALSTSSKEGKVKTDVSATSTKFDLSSSTPKSSHKSESFIRKIIETEKIVVKNIFWQLLFGVFLSFFLYIINSSFLSCHFFFCSWHAQFFCRWFFDLIFIPCCTEILILSLSFFSIFKTFFFR